MQTGRFKKFVEVVFGRTSLQLEVTFDSHYEPLAGVVSFIATIAVAGHYGNATGWRFCPFLPPLTPLLALLMVALVGMARPSPAVIPALPRMKVAPTAPSPEACRVAMSSSSMIVFGHSRLSSLTKVRHVMPS
jgi:hypothetical protein